MSHDRGCWRCNEDPSEYARCQRADCPKRDRFHNPQPGDRHAITPLLKAAEGVQRTTTRIMPKPVERPPTRIISVTNPGYDVLIFMHRDGSAHALISKPNEPQPTTVLIGAPDPGRCIAVERRNGTFDVVYKDVQP